MLPIKRSPSACGESLFANILSAYPIKTCGRDFMGTILLKLPEHVLEISCRCAKTLHLPISAYIRQAIEQMNHHTQAQLRSERLANASKKVRKESLRVNREFDAIELTPLS
jgi:hypothetical protein